MELQTEFEYIMPWGQVVDVLASAELLDNRVANLELQFINPIEQEVLDISLDSDIMNQVHDIAEQKLTDNSDIIPVDQYFEEKFS
jgi:hypothetical protein